jgi:acetylornithine deacetylase/succinyl-diaminopimelate desuccinylase-like protein
MTVIATPAAPHEPDWHAAHQETLAHLQAMLRMNTVNPPGNELQVARHIETTLTAEGIEVQLFEPTPGRGAVVARLRGDGSRQPVLLMGHMDTVGVEAEHWSVDPFGGVVQDGYAYGRGAIDDKGMLAVNLETMLLLKRTVLDAGLTLSRDVIFVANSDEEATGRWGMGWLLANHPELIRAEFALNEGGRIRVVAGRPLYVALQNTEKVPHTLTVTAHGPGGHASVPLAGNAILRLGRAIARLSTYREPVQVNPTTREFFAELGRVWPNREERAAMADVASNDTRRVQRGARILERIPVFDAVLRNGISVTIVNGGIRSNVIPTEATATLNVRTLPGQSIDGVVRRLRRVIADPGIDIAVTERGDDAPASDFGSALFVALRESALALDPSLAVVPYMSTGATDSARLRAWGIQAIGILPFPMDQDDEDRMHGNDERVPLASLDFGMRMVYGAMLRVAR